MLESSKTDMAEATVAERQVAELFAHAYLTSELEQNLIPTDEAHRTILDHQTTESETWKRAVHAALLGLRAARERGYTLSAPPST